MQEVTLLINITLVVSLGLIMLYHNYRFNGLFSTIVFR